MNADPIYYIGMTAVAVNAITGVIEAGRKNIDLVGAITIALAAALGGGTLRDLLLQRKIFWITDSLYLVVALLSGITIFFVIRRRPLPAPLFLIPDAVGLALFSVVGTTIALEWNISWLAASLLGVITGVFGGMLRDLLCNTMPLVLRDGEIYASAAWLGTLALIALRELGVSPGISTWSAMLLILVLRLGAIRLRLKLPTLPPRE